MAWSVDQSIGSVEFGGKGPFQRECYDMLWFPSCSKGQGFILAADFPCQFGRVHPCVMVKSVAAMMNLRSSWPCRESRSVSCNDCVDVHGFAPAALRCRSSSVAQAVTGGAKQTRTESVLLHPLSLGQKHTSAFIVAKHPRIHLFEPI